MQTDHKGPNPTFMTLKMTFRVAAHHLYYSINITPMKLDGARKLGSTSVLLNNIDKYVNLTFPTLKKTFRAIQANQTFGSSSVPFLGSSMQK